MCVPQGKGSRTRSRRLATRGLPSSCARPRAARRARLVVCAAPSPRLHSTKLNRHGACFSLSRSKFAPARSGAGGGARAHGIMLHSMGGFLWDRACLCARPCPVAVLWCLRSGVETVDRVRIVRVCASLSGSGLHHLHFIVPTLSISGSRAHW